MSKVNTYNKKFKNHIKKENQIFFMYKFIYSNKTITIEQTLKKT